MKEEGGSVEALEVERYPGQELCSEQDGAHGGHGYLLALFNFLEKVAYSQEKWESSETKTYSLQMMLFKN